MHDFDDDGVCYVCGFDGTEWWHLERMKPKEDRQPSPPCGESGDMKPERPKVTDLNKRRYAKNCECTSGKRDA